MDEITTPDLAQLVIRIFHGHQPTQREAEALAAEVIRLRKQVETLLEVVGVPESTDVEDMPENVVND